MNSIFLGKILIIDNLACNWRVIEYSVFVRYPPEYSLYSFDFYFPNIRPTLSLGKGVSLPRCKTEYSGGGDRVRWSYVCNMGQNLYIFFCIVIWNAKNADMEVCIEKCWYIIWVVRIFMRTASFLCKLETTWWQTERCDSQYIPEWDKLKSQWEGWLSLSIPGHGRHLKYVCDIQFSSNRWFFFSFWPMCPNCMNMLLCPLLPA